MLSCILHELKFSYYKKSVAIEILEEVGFRIKNHPITYSVCHIKYTEFNEVKQVIGFST